MGGEDEESPTRNADSKAIGPKSRAIVRKLKASIPELDLEIDYAWAGAFGQSTTSMPLIGAVPGMLDCYAWASAATASPTRSSPARWSPLRSEARPNQMPGSTPSAEMVACRQIPTKRSPNPPEIVTKTS